ncbi:MAG: vitamin K epoxide reductase family protein [Bdellovibrionota bacterium]
MKLSRSQVAFLFICILGLGLSIWSAHHWYELHSGALKGKSFCNVTDYWNCDRVSASEMSHFKNIPWGIFSAAYFLILALIGLAGERVRRWLFVFFIPAWAVSLFLIYQLVWVLKTGCIICYAMDFCWFSAGILSLRRKNWTQFSGLPLLIIGFVGAGLLSLYAVQASAALRKLPPKDELDRFKSWLWNQPQVTIPMKTPFVRPSLSSKKIQIVEFSDFQCPHCRTTALSTVPFLLAQSDVEFLLFPYPIDSKCHPDLKGRPARQSCDWTRVAICAQKQDRFSQVHERIYELAQSSRPQVDAENLSKLDLDQKTLEACLFSDETTQTLNELVQVGRDLEIAGTPTFFIDGYRLPGGLGNSIFRILLDDLRSRN